MERFQKLRLRPAVLNCKVLIELKTKKNWRAGKPAEAIKQYKKAIAMDPDGPTGANAKSVIQRIEEEQKKKGF